MTVSFGLSIYLFKTSFMTNIATVLPKLLAESSFFLTKIALVALRNQRSYTEPVAGTMMLSTLAKQNDRDCIIAPATGSVFRPLISE